ncbi:hypothetical protein J6590_083405 [Homalodisca vitripennis]|nr:hypothetical protein J6590_083405 [Homalodisca vitripennis]
MDITEANQLGEHYRLAQTPLQTKNTMEIADIDSWGAKAVYGHGQGAEIRTPPQLQGGAYSGHGHGHCADLAPPFVTSK